MTCQSAMVDLCPKLSYTCLMIQSKAKNKYWQAGKRWRTCSVPSNILGFDFENYQYIIGDKIYTECSPEAEEAYKQVLMWKELQQ